MISTCIITKNEDFYIEDCINSIIDISNEIILLDTGSNDKTLEIAKKFKKVKIYHYVWENDFSKARNKCISYAKNKWIFNIDADQRLVNDKKLKNKLESLNDNNLYIIDLKIEGLDLKNSQYNFNKALIFTKSDEIYYKKPIHETLVSENKNIIYKTFEDIIINDIGESSRTKEELISKKLKYLDNILDVIKKSSENEIIYYLRHLGDTHFYLDNHNLALESFIESYKLAKKIKLDDKEYYINIILRIVKELVFYHYKYKLALDYLDKLAFYNKKNYEFLFYLGFCKNRLNDINGIKIHKELLEILLEKNDDNYLIFNTCLEIGIFSIKLGDKKGINFLLKAHKLFPDSIQTIKEIVSFFYNQNDLQRSAYFLDKIIHIPETITENNLRNMILNFIKDQKLNNFLN